MVRLIVQPLEGLIIPAVQVQVHEDAIWISACLGLWIKPSLRIICLHQEAFAAQCRAQMTLWPEERYEGTPMAWPDEFNKLS